MRHCTRVYTAIQIRTPRKARKKANRDKWTTIVEFPENMGDWAEDLGRWIWEARRQKRWTGWRVVKLAEEYGFASERRVDVLDVGTLVED